MLPQFGEYVAFKLDPVASLKALDDPEVTKACEALRSHKTYVSCVTYVCCLIVCMPTFTEYHRSLASIVSVAWRRIHIREHDFARKGSSQ